MPYFSDAQDVYEHLGKLVRHLVADEQLGARLQHIDTVFQYRLHEPDAQVTVKALAAEERAVALATTTLQPQVVLAMDADTAHRFWLGALNPAAALADGDIKVRGPAAKVLELIGLVPAVAPLYRAQLEADGREDLVAAS